MINSFKGQYRWLSNFWPVDIVLAQNTYKSVEHAYMSAKSDDPAWKRFCMDTESPGQIKKKSREIQLRDKWDELRIPIMTFLVTQKFLKQPFKANLLATGEQNIVEGNTWGDTFWGVDTKITPNYGENHLGRIIMDVRNMLKDANGIAFLEKEQELGKALLHEF